VSRGDTRWKKKTVGGWAENLFDSTFLTTRASIPGMNTNQFIPDGTGAVMGVGSLQPITRTRSGD